MSVEQLQQIISPKFTQQVLLDIVKKKSDLTEIQIKKIEIGAASKKGDSYLSDICRFTLEATGYNKEKQEQPIFIPVIAKYFPRNIARRKTYRSAEFFENEYLFYTKVWEPFKKFQEEAGIEKKFEDIPLLLSAYLDGTNDYIAMLDLSYEGFRSAERAAGLDYAHTTGILQLLARFHALSLAFKEQQPEKFEEAANSLKETYFAERLRPWYCNFQKNVFAVIRDAVEKELPPEYLQKLNKLIDNDLYGVLIRSCVVRDRFSVVTHGDVWAPNFLVKYEDNKPGKIKMIDFQLARYTTLVTDLAFFLYSCASTDLIEFKWDELVALYHQTLAQSLKDYGAKKIITLEDLQNEMRKHAVMGVGMSMEALIMAQLEDEDVSDLDAIEGTEAVPLESVWMVKPFREQEKRKRIAFMIKLAADRNFI